MPTPDPPIPKLPPYRLPPAFTDRPPSPSQQNGLPSGTAPAAYGCELIIRDVTPTTGLSAAQTVEAAIKAAALDVPDAATKFSYVLPSHPDRTLWHITLLPTRTPTDTYCYARVSQHVAALDAQPRPDLLEDWIDVLRALNADWKPDWSPARDGRDKSMWIKVSGLSGNGKDAGKAELALVVKQLDTLGVKVASFWSMDSGRDGTLILRYTADVARVVTMSFLDVILPTSADPRPSPSRIMFSQPFVQVQPEGAFELAVKGIFAQYDYSFKTTLDQFFKQFGGDGRPTLFSCSRIVGDAYIFRMRTWESTQWVVQGTELFDRHIRSAVPDAHYPRLVYDLNSTSSWARNPTAVAQETGGHMQAALDVVTASIDSLRKDQMAGFAALNQRVGSVEHTCESLAQNMLALTDITTKSRHSMFSLHVRSQLADDRARLIRQIDHASAERMYEPDPAVKKQLHDELQRLRDDVRAIDEKLYEADRAITADLAPPSIPAPQPLRPVLASALASSSSSSLPATPTRKRQHQQPAAPDVFSATTQEVMQTEDEEDTTAVAQTVIPEDTEMDNAS